MSAREIVFKSFSDILSLVSGTYYPPRSRKIINLISRIKKSKYDKFWLDCGDGGGIFLPHPAHVLWCGESFFRLWTNYGKILYECVFFISFKKNFCFSFIYLSTTVFSINILSCLIYRSFNLYI